MGGWSGAQHKLKVEIKPVSIIIRPARGVRCARPKLALIFRFSKHTNVTGFRGGVAFQTRSCLKFQKQKWQKIYLCKGKIFTCASSMHTLSHSFTENIWKNEMIKTSCKIFFFLRPRLNSDDAFAFFSQPPNDLIFSTLTQTKALYNYWQITAIEGHPCRSSQGGKWEMVVFGGGKKKRKPDHFIFPSSDMLSSVRMLAAAMSQTNKYEKPPTASPSLCLYIVSTRGSWWSSAAAASLPMASQRWGNLFALSVSHLISVARLGFWCKHTRDQIGTETGERTLLLKKPTL